MYCRCKVLDCLAIVEFLRQKLREEQSQVVLVNPLSIPPLSPPSLSPLSIPPLSPPSLSPLSLPPLSPPLSPLSLPSLPSLSSLSLLPLASHSAPELQNLLHLLLLLLSLLLSLWLFYHCDVIIFHAVSISGVPVCRGLSLWWRLCYAQTFPTYSPSWT